MGEGRGEEGRGGKGSERRRGEGREGPGMGGEGRRRGTESFAHIASPLAMVDTHVTCLFSR